MGEVGISVLLDGNLIQGSGISRFTYIPTGREYLIYSLNETITQNGKELNKIYVSEIGEANAQLTVINDNDWNQIKNIMYSLSAENAEIPNNIQLGHLDAKQYTVGPYKKLALPANLYNGLVATQNAKQPSESSEITPPPSTNQFIQTPQEDTQEVVQEQTVVPSAFSMTAPVPEQTAPIALVSDPSTQTTTQPVEEVPASEIIAPPQEVVTQTVETPVATQEVVAIPTVQVQTTDINQSVKNIIDNTNGDVNEIIDLFKTNGVDLSANQVQTSEPVVEQEVPAVVETPAPASIDINNLPVANQPVALPNEELAEEAIVPSTPTLPADDNSTNSLTEESKVVEQAATTIVQTVAPEPTAPVTQIVQPTQEVVQPVVQETVPVQTVVPEPTVPVTQVVQPTQEVVQSVVQETVPVQTVVTEPTVPVSAVVTETIAPASSEPTTQEITQDMQNSTVSFDIPEEPTQAVENNNVSGIPTILPLTAEDLQPQTPSESPSGVETPDTSQSAEDDKSFLAAAGPVVMPIGQEQTNAAGYPGDSGQN